MQRPRPDRNLDLERGLHSHSRDLCRALRNYRRRREEQRWGGEEAAWEQGGIGRKWGWVHGRRRHKGVENTVFLRRRPRLATIFRDITRRECAIDIAVQMARLLTKKGWNVDAVGTNGGWTRCAGGIFWDDSRDTFPRVGTKGVTCLSLSDNERWHGSVIVEIRFLAISVLKLHVSMCSICPVSSIDQFLFSFLFPLKKCPIRWSVWYAIYKCPAYALKLNDPRVDEGTPNSRTGVSFAKNANERSRKSVNRVESPLRNSEV